jgi:BASS family bile acid:Na+ symporter
VKKLSIYSLSVFGALCACLTAIFLSISGNHSIAGPFVICFFLLLAMAFQGYEQLKGFSFTISIFAAVSTSLYYPQYFLEWGGFKLSGLIIPLLQIIMFGMGTAMSIKDFAAVVKTPKGVVIGIIAQFTIMPVIGMTLASVSGLPPEIAAGIILVGCSPSGVASNVMSYLAKANLALSITLTSCTTLLAPFVTPLLMKYLAGAYIEIDATKMMFDIIKMIILPVLGGLAFNKILSGKTAWLDKLMPKVSMLGIALIIVVITAAGRDSLLSIGPLLILLTLTHNIFGYLLGYGSAKLFKMSESDARTVAIEVGLQNAGLASGIAKTMGKIATIGLAAGVFGPVMNITGSMLASFWHKRSPDKLQS